jgi:hypothetical protein
MYKITNRDQLLKEYEGKGIVSEIANLWNYIEYLENQIQKLNEQVRPLFGAPYKLQYERLHKINQSISDANKKLLANINRPFEFNDLVVVWDTPDNIQIRRFDSIKNNLYVPIGSVMGFKHCIHYGDLYITSIIREK